MQERQGVSPTTASLSEDTRREIIAAIAALRLQGDVVTALLWSYGVERLSELSERNGCFLLELLQAETKKSSTDKKTFDVL